jgi:phosphoglucosamine mutase
MYNNIFGTAGIRSQAGQYPLDQKTLIKLGRAISQLVINKYGKNARILIANDTRISSDLIKTFIKCGLLQKQIYAYDAQVLPTPAVHYLVHKMNLYDCGIIITASHNPYTDNGIKIVDRLNGNLENQEELFISNNVDEDENIIDYTEVGQEYHVKSAQNTYIQKILDQFSSHSFENTSVIIDCANGAMATIAPIIFRKLGIKVTAINTQPNGRNINTRCGSTNPTILQKTVLKYKAQIGFAFDGDGDRILAVTATGKLKNGDDLIAFLSTHPKYIEDKQIVGTIISNYGLELWLQEQFKLIVKCNVGEKNVLTAMQKNNCNIGGESSGHIIIKNFADHSDGVFSALKILETAILTNNWELKTFTRTPQVTNNISVTIKKDLNQQPFVDIIKKYQTLAKPGRLIVRYSGTENLLRVLFEGKDIGQLKDLAQQIKLDLKPLLCQ